MPRASLSDDVLALIRCPHCQGSVDVGEDATCRSCGRSYPTSPALDLRPLEPIALSMPLRVGTPGPDLDRYRIGALGPCPAPEVDFEGVSRPGHISAALRSWIPAPAREGAVALDHGCGAALMEGTLEHAGYRYVGMDYDNPEAPMWGDAHALPYEDDSFDLIISIAVLEHLHNPLRAMQEMVRVLRPGGIWMGTVAFLEPYHSRSYFHHSALGILHLLEETGLAAEFVAPQSYWTVLDAQPKALYPKMPRPVQRVVTAPQRWLADLWWAVLRLRNRTYFTTDRRLMVTAGAFDFLARKPEAADPAPT